MISMFMQTSMIVMTCSLALGYLSYEEILSE